MRGSQRNGRKTPVGRTQSNAESIPEEPANQSTFATLFGIMSATSGWAINHSYISTKVVTRSLFVTCCEPNVLYTYLSCINLFSSYLTLSPWITIWMKFCPGNMIITSEFDESVVFCSIWTKCDKCIFICWICYEFCFSHRPPG